jgi:dipeptidyl aminopeptidase/acylaminoacyl peptidase
MPLVRCTECGERFSPGELVGGRRCPECGAPFALRPDDEERERRFEVRKKGSYRPVLFALLGSGLVLLLLCGGLIAFIVYTEMRPTFPTQKEDYADARARFQTRLTRRGPAPAPDGPVDGPPPETREITYASGQHRFRAWVSAPSPFAGARRPAVLYLHNGFAFGADDWDQAKPFRDAGYVLLIPILRGENGQPGDFSVFYDEVDDVLAAAEELARQPHVDPNRLYVAGHSTGGTLALLAAMTSKRFRAAASFSDSPDQGAWARAQDFSIPFDLGDPREVQMRSPLAFPRSFKCPVRLYYGSQEDFFEDSSEETAKLARKAGLDVQAVRVPGNHMTAVAPAMRQAITFFQSK